ncbi:MAG: helix-turn-helix domain-containing protein [Bacteroidetes bacterium]|nr:helix-turn-helix domain-containing protein [Bacteroidota bacterium]
MAIKKKSALIKKTIHVKNMVCNCCIRLLRKELDIDGITIQNIKLGTIELSHDPGKISLKMIHGMLEDFGFEIITDKEKILVEQIRQAMIELIHNSTYNAMVRNSDYLVERFEMSYPYISSLFSKHENITLEKFTILHKIEKVKELIEYGELTLSEIAYMMGYSSVQYLSTQFKSVTGISVTDYKASQVPGRKPLENLTSGI